MWSGPSVVTEPQPNAGPLPLPPAAPTYDPLYSDVALGPMLTLPSLPALLPLPPLPASEEEEEEVPAPMFNPASRDPTRDGLVINTGTAQNPNNRVINIPLISSKPAPRVEDMFGPAPPPSHRTAAAPVVPKPEAPVFEEARGPEAPEETPGAKLFLGGLNYDTEEQGLRAYFGKWGTVIDCLVLRDKNTEKSRGFGFVTLVEEEAVDLILKAAA